MKILAKFFGITIIILINYILICCFLYGISATLLIYKITPNIKLIKEYQRNYYLIGGLRNLWQSNEECIEYDEDTIFVPKKTSCKFNNIEFDTTIRFDQNGRYSDIKKDLSKKYITVVGDSHAMGWGVNDNQTFSYLLEKKIKKPVFNLSVSGYGTVRELLRLEKSGLLSNSDTIIIQYCYNDFGENVGFKKENKIETRRKFEMVISGKTTNLFTKLRKSIRYATTIPIDILTKKNKSMDFDHHKEVIFETLEKFPALHEKKIILFYANGFDMFFYNFPNGRSSKMKNLYFLDVNLQEKDFFQVDGHLNEYGHRKITDSLTKFFNN